jgi:hypothetical protein
MEYKRYEEVRVKFALKQSMKAQRGVKVQLYSIFKFGASSGWVVNATPQPL